ncbi:hypothetical protein FRC03_000416 [Tulasnella sp. 419]|nr:hypothetical protein FRC03_000416 [Tulasnella sp. 419]
MLRSQSSPITATIHAVASISEAFSSSTTTTLSTNQPQVRTSTSSDDTVTGSYTESTKSSLRKRAKAWARPNLTRSPPKDKEKPLPGEASLEAEADEEYDSETEVEDDDDEVDSGVDFTDDITQPPPGWKPSREFNLVDPAVRRGSKVVSQEAYEVPYPVSYDKVMMENDDHAYELIKALTPNRTGLSFHQFQKHPPSVLDLGCGEGRWILEAATHWKHTRFTGLDLMDIQPDLSHKYFDDVRDRVKWVHSNFLHYRLPFDACQFDFVRMCHVALAIPKHKWKGLLQEIRRVLKPTGVLEWIDEDSSVLPLANLPTSVDESLENAQELEHDFISVLKQRQLYKPHKLFPSLLRGRAFSMRCEEVAKFKLALPNPVQQKEDNGSGLLFPGAKGASMRQIKTLSTSSYVLVGTDDLDKPMDSIVHSSTRVPPGLIILGENKLLPLCPSDIEAQASYNYQTLLGSKEAIWKFRQGHLPGASQDRDHFESKMWDYECGRYTRLQLPSESASGWDESDDEDSNTLASINHRRRAPITLHRITPTPNEKLTVVRSIRVFHAYSESS